MSDVELVARWRFDAEVTGAFDDMLERSIPDYDAMRALVDALSLRVLDESSAPRRIVDLGASRGEASARLLATYPEATLHAIEISESMLAACAARLAPYPNARADAIDLRGDYPELRDVDLVLAVLTLQFVPIEHRARIVRDVERSLRPGGTFVLVEKVLGGSLVADELLVDLYYDRKRANGYSDEEILRKRLALEGVLVPQTAAANESLLAAHGFRLVECFWRSLNFAGWFAVKEGA